MSVCDRKKPPRKNSGEIFKESDQTHQQLLTPDSPLTLPPGAVPQVKAGGRQGNTPL